MRWRTDVQTSPWRWITRREALQRGVAHLILAVALPAVVVVTVRLHLLHHALPTGRCERRSTMLEGRDTLSFSARDHLPQRCRAAGRLVPVRGLRTDVRTATMKKS